MTYKIPPQYSDPTKSRQVDPDNNDPDMYDVETGIIFNGETGEVIGHAEKNNKNYDGSKEDLHEVDYHVKTIDPEDMAKFLTNQKATLDGKITNLNTKLATLPDGPEKTELQNLLKKAQADSGELGKHIDALKGAKTDKEKKKALNDAQDPTKNAVKDMNDLSKYETPTPPPSSGSTPPPSSGSTPPPSSGSTPPPSSGSTPPPSSGSTPPPSSGSTPPPSSGSTPPPSSGSTPPPSSGSTPPPSSGSTPPPSSGSTPPPSTVNPNTGLTTEQEDNAIKMIQNDPKAATYWLQKKGYFNPPASHKRMSDDFKNSETDRVTREALGKILNGKDNDSWSYGAHLANNDARSGHKSGLNEGDENDWLEGRTTISNQDIYTMYGSTKPADFPDPAPTTGPSNSGNAPNGKSPPVINSGIDAAQILYDGMYGGRKGGIMDRMRQFGQTEEEKEHYHDGKVNIEFFRDIANGKGNFSQGERAAARYFAEHTTEFNLLDRGGPNNGQGGDRNTDGWVDISDHNGGGKDGDIANYLENNDALWGKHNKGSTADDPKSDFH